jgi:uncharacterized membrane protein
MEEVVKSVAGIAAACSELIAVVAVAAGAFQAIAAGVMRYVRTKTRIEPLIIFRGFAGWLVLSLEFLVAADILKSAISPTWTEIGQLAAIVVIRTFLNYSLGHDLEHTPTTGAAA